MSDLILSGKRALVVGGSSGIGLAIARTFVNEGAHVVIGGRTQSKLDTALGSLNGEADTVQIDISDERAVSRLFSQFNCLDVLVVTAAERGASTLRGLSTEKMEVIFRTKFYGTFWTAKYGSSVMGRDSSIITVSGIWGHRPPPGFIAGAAVNGAVEGLTRALAAELASDGIRVNCIAPGITKTNPYVDEDNGQMQPHLAAITLDRFGYPSEIASAALFLATNSYVTGTILFVDGGSLTSWPQLGS